MKEKIFCTRMSDEEGRDTVIGLCRVERDSFIDNGRILADGVKSIMFDDCKDGGCNLAIIADSEEGKIKTQTYPGDSESENLEFALERLNTDLLQTAKLKDIEVEEEQRR